MANVRTISQQIRLLFTAVTLFCVLLLNNQEITTYRVAPEKLPANANTQLHQGAAEKPTVVKQKVTFEATTSYLVLQLAHFTDWLHPAFSRCPLVSPLPVKISQGIFFFRILYAFAIVPNAP